MKNHSKRNYLRKVLLFAVVICCFLSGLKRCSFPVYGAEPDYESEVKNAVRAYCSDTIFVTVTKYQTEKSQFYLTHVMIAYASQLKAGMSFDTYGGQRELPSDAAVRQNWIVGVNGSNFSYDTGKPVHGGVVIKNSQIMEGTTANGMEICRKKDGTLFSPTEGTSGEELIQNGVTDTWSCGDTLLIENGKGVNYGIQSQQERYPRTAVGMVGPGEYYLITAGESDYNGGMTYDEVRDVLLEKGCTFGKCMDGGGSSVLIFFCGEVINTPAQDGVERAVCDFLYFTEG